MNAQPQTERAFRARAGAGPVLTIVEAVASETALTTACILGPRRTNDIALARQIAMHVARKRLRWSYPRIGHVIGRDHSTVQHGAGVIAMRLNHDEELRELVARIEGRLEQQEGAA